MISRRSPFVVFGASKSGTTWLQQILDSHPEIRCHFQTLIFPFDEIELKRLSQPKRNVFNQRRSPFKGVFGSAIEEEEYLLKKDFLKSFKLLQTGFVNRSNDQATVIQIKERLIRSAVWELLNDDGGASQLYGTKAYTNIENFLGVFPNGKVICILRDARDVVVSRRFHVLRMGGYLNGDEKSAFLRRLNGVPNVARVLRKIGAIAEDSFRTIDDDHKEDVITRQVIDAYGSDWRKVNAYLLEMSNRYPDAIVFVRYEDLKSRKIEEIRSLLSFLEVEASETELSAIDETTKIRPKSITSTSFLRKGVVGDWKNYFDENDRAYSKRVFGDLLIELGYERNSDW